MAPAVLMFLLLRFEWAPAWKASRFVQQEEEDELRMDASANSEADVTFRANQRKRFAALPRNIISRGKDANELQL